MNNNSEQMDVEVCYAEPDRQLIKQVRVPVGATAGDAVRLSEIRQDFPQIPADDNIEIGIFSKHCTLSEVLRSGDRVEIYRPLLIDPKEARRLKAEVAARRKAQKSTD